MHHGERFNGYTHLAGSLLAVAGVLFLMSMPRVQADPWRMGSIAVYGSTLCLLFLASTLYHGTQGEMKNFFRKVDHCSIYLVIAGTWTPFALVTLHGVAGWTLFGAVWGLALLGIAQECWIARGMRLTSLVIYLLMGWIAIFALEPLIQALTWNGFAWLLAGGLVYTFGIIFYLYDERFTHWHGIWHLVVLVGSAVHYVTILQFVA